MISFIIPSYNNLNHLKNLYSSIKRNEPDVEIIIIDDASTDGTSEWVRELQKTDDELITFRSDTRVGHTILYDAGIELATNEIVGILHADMIVGPNYVRNILKHLKKGIVVCGTRIEPPLHPAGKEKIIRDFGMNFNTLDILSFESFCIKQQSIDKDNTTKGMFAPWVLYKEDFQSIGGHDPLFAPFPYEDSDIFQRWLLAGYELIQSRDAFVYHLTCRGHRWTEQIGKDDEYFKEVSNKAAKNYIRKWGSWIRNDEYQHPIIPPKYNIGFVVKNSTIDTLKVLEPYCDRLYIDDEMGVLITHYINSEQSNTLFDLKKRLVHSKYNNADEYEDIVVEFDWKYFNVNSMNILQNIHYIINDSGAIGKFEMDIFTITINQMKDYTTNLINLNDSWYVDKLI